MEKLILCVILYFILSVICYFIGFWSGRNYEKSTLQKRIKYLEGRVYSSGVLVEELVNKNNYKRLEDIFKNYKDKIEITYEESTKQFICLIFVGLEQVTFSSTRIESLLDKMQDYLIEKEGK